MNEQTQTIRTSTNLYLWLLTGRSNNFFNRALNTGVDYNVVGMPDYVAEARQLLHFDETRHDFYVISAMAATYSLPELLRSLPPEVPTMFAPGAVRIPESRASVPLLPPTGATYPYFDGSVAGRQGFYSAAIHYKDALSVTVRFDNGSAADLPYTLVTDDGALRLSIADAVATVGLGADLRVTQWQSGDTVDLLIAPSQYPFEEIAATINANPRMLRLLLDAGIMEVFAATTEPTEKVGALCIAVISQMHKALAAAGPGFEVITSVNADLSSSLVVAPAWLTE